MEVVSRFERYYFGDSILKRFDVDVEARTVCLHLDRASLLRDKPNPSIFDPELRFEPATVLFTDCSDLRVSEGSYAMNNTVVEFSAAGIEGGKAEFRFALTGGRNNDTFWRELTIVAGGFSVA